MKPKSTLILDNEFIQYCELNKIDNVNKLAQETFNRGFSLLKYGETPSGRSTEKEKIIEVVKYVEVPVEIIKEVKVIQVVEKEVIKEVPVEIIKENVLNVIQEVPVEKVVIKEIIVEKLIDDNECKNMLITLTEANSKLKEELETLTKALNKFNKGSFMKNSDLNSLYDE